MKKNRIVCFGEILWDTFPTHKVAGGAPLNVSFHANNFGLDTQLISAVGNDKMGEELIKFLTKNKIAKDCISINHSLPTSTVEVKLDKNGNARYDIKKDVAWDALDIDESSINIVSEADVLLFGSLVCREENNLDVLLQLIEKAQSTLFDVNFRAPFYQQSIIEQLLHKADIVKMNEEELEEIIGWYNIEESRKDQMIFLTKKFNIDTLVMTAGKNGAYCMHDGLLLMQKGFPVEVLDTVGSGDSFLAALVFKLLNGNSWQECLQFACATGSLVATKSGGTPVIEENTILEFLNKNKNENST